MIAAFDVHYPVDTGASAAALLFPKYTDPKPVAVYTRLFARESAAYVPGEFYKRELPCILSLMEKIEHSLDEVIIDGYVILGTRPGFGWHLFESLSGEISVIGVAKSKYKASTGVEIFRGKSLKPLYVTAAGISPKKAAENIKRMHGVYRIPTLLKQVDLMARETARSYR